MIETTLDTDTDSVVHVDFFVTFGNKDFSREGGWVRLTKCSSRSAAMKFCRKKFGNQFDKVRDKFEFKSKHFPEGELDVYEVNA